MHVWTFLFRFAGAVCFLLASVAVAPDAFAETDLPSNDDDFVASFQRRATVTQSRQPGWSVPLLSPHAGLIQSFRADFTRKTGTGDGTWIWDYGGGKGFNFIPLPNTQVDINVPSYFDKSTDGNDGYGDMQVGVKYRLFTADEKHGNYSAMLGFASSLPTSRSSNGQTHHVITPSLTLGKGWGRWDVQSSATLNLPVGNTRNIGRNVNWNTLVQLKVGKYLWPELESNTTFFRDGGANRGNVQSFLLPGLMSKVRFKPHNTGSRLGLAAGFGWQFAVSPFRTYDHTPVASVRFAF